jgi:RimJ/RimL family protein N-acetyltransferase
MLGPMPTTAPTLETERLRLHGHGVADFADSAAMWGDAEVMRFMGGRPFSEEEVWTRLLRYIGHWAAMGYGYWAIRDKASGRFLGEAGFADLKRAVDPPFGEAPEIGWALVPSAHGRGIGREAVAAVLAWGDAAFGQSSRTVCMINPENLASVRLATRFGYQPYAQAEYKGAPTVLFERNSSASQDSLAL